MVSHYIDNYPLANAIVSLSIATQISDARVHIVTVTLTSLVVLTPSAVRYFETNNLWPEALSKAGLDESTTYTTVQQTSYNEVNGMHVYVLQFTVA